MGLLLIGVAISSVVLFRTRPAAPEEGRTPSLGVAYFLKEAELIGMGKEGKVLYRVTADSASQRHPEDVEDIFDW